MKQVRFIVLIVLSLFLFSFMANAVEASIFSTVKNIVNKVVTAIKNFVTKVVNTFKTTPQTVSSIIGAQQAFQNAGDNTNNQIGSGGNGGDSGSTGTKKGSIISNTFKVYEVKTIEERFIDVSSDYQYYDIDIVKVDFQCVNCPTNYQNIPAFDYKLLFTLKNTGNVQSNAVFLDYIMEMPDETIKDSFRDDFGLFVSPGTYTSSIIIKGVGIKNGKIQEWAFKPQTIKTLFELSNDRAVIKPIHRMKEIRTTICIEKSIFGFCTKEDVKYSFEDIYTCIDGKKTDATGKSCEIPDDPKENKVLTEFKLNPLTVKLLSEVDLGWT